MRIRKQKATISSRRIEIILYAFFSCKRKNRESKFSSRYASDRHPTLREMRGLRNAGRGRIKQGGHPSHHKKRGRFCRRIPEECYPGDRQLGKGTVARRIHRQDKSKTGRDGCVDCGKRQDRRLYAGV